jgi:hypothetical protein
MWSSRCEDNTKAYTTKVERTETAVKKIQWKYPTKEIKNKRNDVPKGTEDKVYSAVISPVISVTWVIVLISAV